ncbi:hypothetical protein Tco_0943201, partial [Tanacetum coccineum]
TNDFEVRPPKEYLIKFSVMNGKEPLTLDFKTFIASTGLDYAKGKYVSHLSTEEVKAGLAKIVDNPILLDRTPILKIAFPVAWRILFTFVIQVLDKNYSSTKQVNSIQQLFTYCLLTRTKVDIGKIIYSDLVTRLTNKSRQKYLSYPRFVSYALEELLGSKYTHDESFRSSPTILSNLNFSKNPSKVTPIELMNFMDAVNNRENLMKPLPFTVKNKIGKSQTVTPTLPQSQGPKASGSRPQKRKRPKSKQTPTETNVTPPLSNPNQSPQALYLIPKILRETYNSLGKKYDPKDLVGNKQPIDTGFPSKVSDEGVAKTTPLPEGPYRDKDSEGLKPPINMEPQTNPVVDPLGTDVEY